MKTLNAAPTTKSYALVFCFLVESKFLRSQRSWDENNKWAKEYFSKICELFRLTVDMRIIIPYFN